MTLVIFSLKNVHYSIDVGDVEEVIPLPAITPLANLPTFVCGIIYLRGSAVPIVDLRKRLGFGEQAYELDNDIIIIKFHNKTMGLIVDKVLSVVDVHENQLIDPSDMINGADVKYMSAVVQIDKEFIFFINLEKILSITEKDTLLTLDGN